MHALILSMLAVYCLAANPVHDRDIPAAAQTTLFNDDNDPFTFQSTTNHDPFTFGTSTSSQPDDSTTSAPAKEPSEAQSPSNSHATTSGISSVKRTSTSISTTTKLTSSSNSVTATRTDHNSAAPTSATLTSLDTGTTSESSQSIPQTSTDQPPASIETTSSPTTDQTAAVTTTIVPPPVTETAVSLSSHCAVGTTCATAVGVGVGLGASVCIGAFLIVSGRYRKYLAASQQSYRDRRRRRHSAHEEYGMSTGKEGEDVDMSSFHQSQATVPPPEYRRDNELFLPDDVQNVVRNVDSMRQQRIRTPADRYGTVSRKPVPKSTNF